MAVKKKKIPSVKSKLVKRTEEEIDRDNKINSYISLVEEVRNPKNKKDADRAFEKIVKMMHSKIKQISYKIKIPGLTAEDLYQESLTALRYKAIKDYDKTRSNRVGLSPFDNFAALCIRRHLSTKLKASFQSKQIIMTKAKSLDQDRSSNNEENVTLADMVPAIGMNVAVNMEEKENYKKLLTKLWDKMSDLEKKVFIYRKQDLSYDEIAKKVYERKNVTLSETKSVDNALSRIKIKAKSLYDTHIKE